MFFFFNDTATTEIYTLSLHDALPISPEDEGLCDAPLLAEPEVGLAREVCDAPLAEEVWRDASRRGLFGDGLRAVLAELRVRALAVGVGPRAARTVEAVLLVQAQERARPTNQTHLSRDVLRRDPDRGDSARRLLRVLYLPARELFGRLRAHVRLSHAVVGRARALARDRAARGLSLRRVRLGLHARVVVRRVRAGSVLGGFGARVLGVAPRVFVGA